jgi:hypothetical protein
MPEEVKEKATKSSFDDILSGLDQDVAKNINIAGAGQSVQFEGKDVSRYLTYGTETFGKLGYDPVKESQKLDELYNANTHWSKDLGRAWDGMWKLAGVGFKDTFAFGATAGSDAHKEFDKVMQDYSSTRGGATQFISNTMLSSGYTVGIMSAIAAEEALLTLTTGGLGLLGTGGEVSKSLLNISKGIKKAEQFRLGRSVEQMAQIKNARMVKEAGPLKSFLKNMSPVGDTYDFLKNVDQLEDLNKFQQGFQGAASLARDARKIHMTNAESKLEANLAKDEMRDELIANWYKDNPGSQLTDEELSKIDEKANKVHDSVLWSNRALIYATNGITFGTMFRSMRLTNKMFNLDAAGKFAVKNFGSKNVLVEAVEQNVKNYLKRKVSQVSLKGTGKWLLESSMEGVQEVSQDLISSVSNDYISGDNKVRGSFYNSLLAGLGDMHAESFFSGMLMGTFASPVGFAIEQTQNIVLKGGHEAVTNPEAYQKRKTATRKELEEDAKFLTEYFQATGTYLDESSRPVNVMAKAQQEMAEAATENDRKKFEDNRRDIFRRGMKTVMKHGLEGQYIEHLEQLKQHSAAEINESLQRTDITEENKSEFISKIDKKINDIKGFKERYDRAQQEQNPISKTSLGKLDPSDPMTFQKKIQHMAFEKYREDIMFTEDAVYDLGERMEALEKEVTNQNFTSKDLATILSKKDLGQEIILLEEQVKSNKEYDVNPVETAKAERKLNAYKALQEAMNTYDELTTLTGRKLSYKTEASYDKLFEAFNDFVTANADVESTPARRVENKQAFDKVWDYMINSTERNNLQDTLNLLRDPERAQDYLKKTAEVLEQIDANKEQHILKSLEEFETFRTSEAMMDELLDNGLFFDLREIDDLMKNNIMPSNVYNADTHKPATQKEVFAAQKIIKRYHKNLKGEYLLKTEEQSYATRKKLKEDQRTDEEILDEYGASANTPIPVSVFLRRLMLNGKSATITEREIANALANSDLGITEVVLSTELDKPLEIKDGQLHIDVRFSASNFRNDNTPFEYMAVSGLLQAHFQAKLESDPELAQQTQELMEKARDAYIEKFDDQKGAKLELFTNKAVFLSESLNNISFQAFLAEVEDTEEVTTKSLWESFLDALRKTLKDLFKDEGTLLTRAMNIATYALDESLIEQVTAQQTPVAEVKEEAPVEEEPVVSTSEEVEKLQEERDDKLEEIDNQIDELAAQLAALEAEAETKTPPVAPTVTPTPTPTQQGYTPKPVITYAPNVSEEGTITKETNNQTGAASIIRIEKDTEDATEALFYIDPNDLSMTRVLNFSDTLMKPMVTESNAFQSGVTKSIKTLKPGKLRKEGDTWVLVEKPVIAYTDEAMSSSHSRPSVDISLSLDAFNRGKQQLLDSITDPQQKMLAEFSITPDATFQSVLDNLGLDVELTEDQLAHDASLTQAPVGEAEVTEGLSKVLSEYDLQVDRKYSAEEIIDIIDRLNVSEETQVAFDKIKDVAQTLGVTVYFTEDIASKLGSGTATSDGVYVLNTHSIYVDVRPLRGNPARLGRTITHEMIHAVTRYVVAQVEGGNPRDLALLTDKQIEGVENLQVILEELRKDSELVTEYGLTNIDELLAELANPKFVKKLKAKKFEDQTFFQRIVSAIAKILNLDTTAYDLVMEQLDYLTENADKFVLERMTLASTISDLSLSKSDKQRKIDAIRKQLADLQAQRNEVEADYNKSVEGLNIDEPAQTRSEKNNKERIQNRIEEIQKEKIALEGKKGLFSFGVKRQLSALAVEEQELRVELDQLGRVEVAPRKPVEPKFEDNAPVEKIENEDGSVEITIYTLFNELPLDLQELLAQEYYKTDGPKQKFERDSNEKTPIERAADSFENPITENDGPPLLRRNQLTEEDVKKIQNRMQHNGYYMEIIGAYRRTKLNPSKKTQAEIADQKTQIAKIMAGRLINKMPATDIVMRGLLDEADFDFYKANKIEIQNEAKSLFTAMMKGQAPITPGKGNLLSVIRVEDLLVLVDDIRDVYDDNQIKKLVGEINKLKTEQERLGRIRELDIEVAEALAEEEEYEKIDLNNLVPGSLMILSDEEADQILGLLNAGTATVEEFVKFVEDKKKEQEGTKDQEKLEEEAANFESNLRLHAELVSGFKIAIDTGRGGVNSKRRYKAQRFSPLFLKLFLEKNPKILKASPEEFRAALNSFYNNGWVKSRNIRKLGFDLEQYGAGTAPYYQLLKYKESLIAAGSWNEDVIKAINYKLKEYGINLRFKNQSLGNMGSIFSRSLVVPVETKVRTIKKKKPAIKKIERSVEYYMDNIQPDILTKQQAVAILYDWLKNNNIHPNTINIPNADYISEKNSVPFNKPDELAEEIFKGYLVQLESLNGPGVIEELLNEFNEKADMLNYLNESLEEEESFEERAEKEAKEREEYEKQKYEEYLAQSNPYYNSLAFLLENGLYNGDVKSLSEAERKLYNKNKDQYLEEPAPSEIYIEEIILNEELAKQSDQDSLNAYVKKVLNTIEQATVTANELVAVYKIAERYQQRFSKDQKTILQDTVLQRLEDVNFVNEVVKLNGDSNLYRLKKIVKEGPSPAVVYLENITTGQIQAVDFNEFLLQQIEEFLPEGSIYIPGESPAEISNESSKLYKEAYSEVFATFMQSMAEMEDVSMPVVKAEIKEEIEKCNGYRNRF